MKYMQDIKSGLANGGIGDLRYPVSDSHLPDNRHSGSYRWNPAIFSLAYFQIMDMILSP